MPAAAVEPAAGGSVRPRAHASGGARGAAREPRARGRRPGPRRQHRDRHRRGPQDPGALPRSAERIGRGRRRLPDRQDGARGRSRQRLRAGRGRTASGRQRGAACVQARDRRTVGARAAGRRSGGIGSGTGACRPGPLRGRGHRRAGGAVGAGPGRRRGARSGHRVGGGRGDRAGNCGPELGESPEAGRGSRRGGPRRPERRHRRTAAPGRTSGCRALPGAHPRRERDGQGTDRPGHPRGLRQEESPLLRRQLRRARRRPVRVGVVRPRTRLLHGRRVGPPRPVRGGGWRDALPRRGRRTVAAGAGQAAARHPGGRDPARGGESPAAGGRAHRCRHEPAARRRGPGRPLPPRPPVPPRRRADCRAAAARAPGGRGTAGQAVLARGDAENRRAGGVEPRHTRRARAVPLARQRARTAEHAGGAGRERAAARAGRPVAAAGRDWRRRRRRPGRRAHHSRKRAGGSRKGSCAPRSRARAASGPTRPRRSASRARGWPRS